MSTERYAPDEFLCPDMKLVLPGSEVNDACHLQAQVDLASAEIQNFALRSEVVALQAEVAALRNALRELVEAVEPRIDEHLYSTRMAHSRAKRLLTKATGESTTA